MDERAAGLLALLPELGEPWPDMPGQLREIRLRTGAPVQLIGERGEWLSRTVTDAAWIGRATERKLLYRGVFTIGETMISFSSHGIIRSPSLMLQRTG